MDNFVLHSLCIRITVDNIPESLFDLFESYVCGKEILASQPHFHLCVKAFKSRSTILKRIVEIFNFQNTPQDRAKYSVVIWNESEKAMTYALKENREITFKGYTQIQIDEWVQKGQAIMEKSGKKKHLCLKDIYLRVAVEKPESFYSFVMQILKECTKADISPPYPNAVRNAYVSYVCKSKLFDIDRDFIEHYYGIGRFNRIDSI